MAKRNRSKPNDHHFSLQEVMDDIKHGDLGASYMSNKEASFLDEDELPVHTGQPTDSYIRNHEDDPADAELLAKIKNAPLDREYIEQHDNVFVDSYLAADEALLTSDTDTFTTANPVNEADSAPRIPLDYWVKTQFVESRIVKCFADKVFLYNEQFGNFDELSETELYIAIRKAIPAEIDMKLGKQKIAEVVHRIKSDPDLQVEYERFDSNAHLINFKNCVLDIRDGTTHPHSSGYMFTSFVNADYECGNSGIRVYRSGSQSDEGRWFNKFVEDCTKGDTKKTRCLQQVTGYILSNEWRAKKFFVLVGLPHTGKSVWLALWRALIGDKHTTAMTFRQLSETRFMTAELFRSKLNVTAEMDENTALKGTDIIKAVTGGDLLTAERKGEHPFRFYGKTKLVAAGNQMPMLSRLDGTSAFTDRMLFLMFNNPIPEERRDKSLMEKLLAEKTFIVRWAVEGLKDLMDNNLIFTESEDAKQFKQQYVTEVNNVPEFIRDRCVLDADRHELKVHRRALYPAYVDFCRNNGVRVLTKDEFYVEVKKVAKSSKFRLNGSAPLWGFLGLQLRSEAREETIEME